MRWEKADRVVKYDKWDEQDWQDALFDINQVQGNIDEIWEKHNFVPDAFADIFMTLFQGDPMNEEKRDIREDHIFNYHIVDQFQSWNEVAELRVSSRYDPYAAAFSMVTLQPEIKRLYEENQELMELMEKIKELLEKLAGEGDHNAAGELGGQIQGLVEEANGKMGDVVVEFRGALKQASQDLAQEDQLMQTFGLEEGQLKRMNYNERRALAEKLKSGKFIQFANLIGQFKLVAKGAKRSKVSTVPDEVAGLELGQDITNLSVEALIELCVPELEMKFWNSYVNHELVQRRIVGPHALGKGPIIVVCDESGSMSMPCYGGTREMWSKALSLALCDQARRNRRDFYYIGFSGGPDSYMVKFNNGRIDHKLLVEFVEHFYGGGTYPFGALMRAAKIVESYKQNRPDIVFCTDGEYGSPGYGDDSNFYEEWDRIKAKTDLQCFGVAFDGEPREMKRIADTIINLEDMQADPSKMSQVFLGIERD